MSSACGEHKPVLIGGNGKINASDDNAKETHIERKYREFYEKKGYIPKYFVPYSCKEVVDYVPTLTANSNVSPAHSGTVLIAEIINNKEKHKKILIGGDISVILDICQRNNNS